MAASRFDARRRARLRHVRAAEVDGRESTIIFLSACLHGYPGQMPESSPLASHARPEDMDARRNEPIAERLSVFWAVVAPIVLWVLR